MTLQGSTNATEAASTFTPTTNSTRAASMASGGAVSNRRARAHRSLWLPVATRGALVAALFAAAAADAQSFRNASQYNLEAGIGLKGFDPVSYFPEGGGQPLQGDPGLAASYRGVSYAFASPAHRELFFQSPERFEPTYGGWCAFAMASGMKVDIDPQLFTLAGNRLHFFVSPRAKALFDADVARYEGRADAHWRRLSGEEPRR